MDICFLFKAIGDFIMHITGNKPAPPPPQIIILPAPTPEPKEPISAPAPPPPQPKRVITEDYMNTSWSTRNAPTLALDRIDVELQNPTDENLRMSTNTCKQLLENFSMLKDRKTRIENIRDKIMKSDSEMAKEIDLGRFSKADWYDGPPNLWR